MAYRITRAKKITESLELIAADGSVAHEITVDLDAEKIAAEFNTRYNAVVRAQKAASAATAQDNSADTQEKAQLASQAVQAFGDAVVALFALVFGEDDTSLLLRFFEGHYVEMTAQIVPFIETVIVPAIEKAVRDTREQLAENYKLSRAQRRKLGL